MTPEMTWRWCIRWCADSLLYDVAEARWMWMVSSGGLAGSRAAISQQVRSDV